MEAIIVTGIIGICVSFIAASKIAQKREERKEIKAEQAKVDAWQERLEVARLVRESHPENFVPGGVELPNYL